MPRPDPNPFRDDWYDESSGPNVYSYHSHPSFRRVPSATRRRTDVPKAYYYDTPSRSLGERRGYYYGYVDDIPQPRGPRGSSRRSNHTNSFPGQAAASTDQGTKEFDAEWFSQRMNRPSVAPKIVQPTPVCPAPAGPFLNGLFNTYEYPPDYTKPAQHRSRPHRSASTHEDRNAFGWKRTYESFESRKEYPSTPRQARPVPTKDQHPASPRRVRSYDTWTSGTTLNDVPPVHSSLPKKSADIHQGSRRRSNNFVSMSAGKANEQFWSVIRDKLETEDQRDFKAECVMNWNYRSLALTLPLTTQISIRITRRLSQNELKDPLTVMMGGEPADECPADEGEMKSLPNVLKSRGKGSQRFDATSTITRTPNKPYRWGLRPEVKWPMRAAEELEAEGYTTEGLASTLLENGGTVSMGMAYDMDLELLLCDPDAEVLFTEDLKEELDTPKSRYPARSSEKSGRRRNV